MDVKEIRIEDFDYPLDDNRIAKYPLAERDTSNLLYWKQGVINKYHFYNLPELLEEGDLLIYNNTKVIQARFHFKKNTGSTIEIFCLEPHSPIDYNLAFQSNKRCEWKCLVGNLKKWKEESITNSITIKGHSIDLTAKRLGKEDDMTHIIEFSWNEDDITFSDILLYFGELPIPPYLNRATEEKDKTTYQTVYSKIDGSVAAPTAGLHFTQKILDKLTAKGIKEKEVTLHVGAGTFQPVKSETIGNHPMHKEIISVKLSTIKELLISINHIVAVGTTSVRTLESLYYIGCHIYENPQNPSLYVDQWEPYQSNYSLTVEESLQSIINYMVNNKLEVINASTRILILPSYKFKLVNKLITNFHQPKSTLLLLISAFTQGDNWKEIYKFALNNNLRFLSYGDSSLLIR